MHSLSLKKAGILARATTLQYGQHTDDDEYRQAMDALDYHKAEAAIDRVRDTWTQLTRRSFIRARQGDLGAALTLFSNAEHAATTIRQRARHLANEAHFAILQGRAHAAAELGIRSVLLDHTAVGGAVNAACGLSIQRSRSGLLGLLTLLSERVPSVLADPHWLERWENDPQLAFGRHTLSVSWKLQDRSF